MEERPPLDDGAVAHANAALDRINFASYILPSETRDEMVGTVALLRRLLWEQQQRLRLERKRADREAARAAELEALLREEYELEQGARENQQRILGGLQFVREYSLLCMGEEEEGGGASRGLPSAVYAAMGLIRDGAPFRANVEPLPQGEAEVSPS